jgi:hypothetical protein
MVNLLREWTHRDDGLGHQCDDLLFALWWDRQARVSGVDLGEIEVDLLWHGVAPKG